MSSRGQESKFDWVDKRVRLLAAAVAVMIGVTGFFAGDRVGEQQSERKVGEARALLGFAASRIAADKANAGELAAISDAVLELVRNPAKSESIPLSDSRQILSGSFWVPKGGGRALTEENISLNVTNVTDSHVEYQIAGQGNGTWRFLDTQLPPPRENCVLNLVTPVYAGEGKEEGAMFRLSCRSPPAPEAGKPG